MHGGAEGSGAPKGERNGMWKHGGYTGEAAALGLSANRLVRAVRIADAERELLPGKATV
jgi:hypothetical protein